jgi:hypothetical protein
MTQKVLPVPVTTFSTCTYPATPAGCSFRGETLDQYSAKHIALFLVDLEIPFNMYKFGDEWSFYFQVLESAAPAVERFLAAIPCSRPSSDESLKPFVCARAESGRLELGQSQTAVAQVAHHEDAQYLVDLWNAFAPVRPVPAA